ncbi:hypothetical protein DPMN_147021 [Dreissena polymorpha]|uniref:Uncharacterized protein n=1 Tax=Dreissena polymorpha TaxID=45954 RepID=A0A9D4J2X8_DREPO|nr:hypothetical protein DPMN_147021 [Dreissena polymorpha]
MPLPWYQYIIGTNRLTKFHDDRTINVISRPYRAPALVQDIIGMNLPTEFHEDRTIKVASGVTNVASRENAPSLGSHVFQANVTIFELIQDIIETNISTKFHEECTINVASRVLTRQMLTPHDA